MTTVRYEVAERIATITIDRPDVKNALGPDEWRALTARVDDAAADGDVRVVVITGAGGTFSAGGDLKTMPERLAEPRDVRAANLVTLAQLVPKMRALPKPVIASLNGTTAGAGACIALASDIRIASEEAKIAFLFVKVGLAGTDMAASYLLPRVVGLSKATELLFTGDFISATEAERIGLYNRVVAAGDLSTTTRDFARRLARGPAFGLAKTKEMLNRELHMNLQTALESEAQAQAICMQHPDYREAYEAFVAKREAKFR